MTDAIVGVLAQQLYNFIKDETKGYFAVQSQLDQMADDLAYMKSFLIDATKLVQHRDKEIVKRSLVNMRELIYNADDILLEYQVRTDYWSHAPTKHCTSFRPQQSFFHYQTGKRLKEINMKISQMRENLKTFCAPIMGGAEIIPEERNHNKRWTPPNYDQSEIVGLSKATNIIKQWILHPNKEMQRVGIVGMGGLGKSTLAQNIYNDEDVTKHFNKRIWLSVSQTFTPIDIMKNMWEQIKEDGSSCTSEVVLLEKIQKALKDKTYLIIMDDVWDTKAGFGWWEKIFTGLPKEAEYNRSIIITTRNYQVATSMGVVEERIHWLEKLNEDESWSLFCKIAFKSPKGECTIHELEKVGKDIVKKCGGLPLAIKTIGGLLSTKPKSINEWKKIHEDFRGKLNENKNDDSVLASLQLSYNELPPELKLCVLCFSIYPEDYIINTEQLVFWWVGEGFASGRNNRTATQVANDSLSELFSRCLIEVKNHRGYDGRIFECKMHDMVRDLIIKIAKEEAFCSFDDEYVQQFKTESRHLGLTSEITTPSLQRKSKLRALLLMKSCPFRFFPSTGLANVNSLRVLDLSQSKQGNICIDDLLRWIKSQRCLAYLNLCGVARLKEVPKWIRKLRNLKILILAECKDLEWLSPDITTLPKLTKLDIRNCPSLRNLPQGLENLSNLEELSGFKIASPDEDGCRLGDLKKLTNLRKLRINIREKDDIKDDDLDVLSHLKVLEILSIDTNNSKNEEILNKVDQLVLPECLQELYLRNYPRDVTPRWLTPCKLPDLHYLCIEHAELKSLKPRSLDDEQQHWNIQGLCLKYLPRLKLDWNTVKTIMPKIEYVEVSRCYDLQNFPWKAANFGFWRKKEDNEEIKEESKEESKDEIMS